MKSIAVGALCVTAGVVGTLATLRLGHGRDVASLGEESSALVPRSPVDPVLPGYGDALDLDESNLGLVLTENDEALAKSELGGVKAVKDAVAKKIPVPDWSVGYDCLRVKGGRCKEVNEVPQPLDGPAKAVRIQDNLVFVGKQRVIAKGLMKQTPPQLPIVCMGFSNGAKAFDTFEVVFSEIGSSAKEEVLKAYIGGIKTVLSPFFQELPPAVASQSALTEWITNELTAKFASSQTALDAADNFVGKLADYFSSDVVISLTHGAPPNRGKFGKNYITLPCGISVQMLGRILLQDKEMKKQYPNAKVNKAD
jgi:hypothetical protein